MIKSCETCKYSRITKDYACIACVNYSGLICTDKHELYEPKEDSMTGKSCNTCEHEGHGGNCKIAKWNECHYAEFDMNKYKNYQVRRTMTREHIESVVERMAGIDEEVDKILCWFRDVHGFSLVILFRHEGRHIIVSRGGDCKYFGYTRCDYKARLNFLKVTIRYMCDCAFENKEDEEKKKKIFDLRQELFTVGLKIQSEEVEEERLRKAIEELEERK